MREMAPIGEMAPGCAKKKERSIKKKNVRTRCHLTHDYGIPVTTTAFVTTVVYYSITCYSSISAPTTVITCSATEIPELYLKPGTLGTHVFVPAICVCLCVFVTNDCEFLNFTPRRKLGFLF